MVERDPGVLNRDRGKESKTQPAVWRNDGEPEAGVLRFFFIHFTILIKYLS